MCTLSPNYLRSSRSSESPRSNSTQPPSSSSRTSMGELGLVICSSSFDLFLILLASINYSSSSVVSSNDVLRFRRFLFSFGEVGLSGYLYSSSLSSKVYFLCTASSGFISWQMSPSSSIPLSSPKSSNPSLDPWLDG